MGVAWPPGRQIGAPELGAALHIEGANMIVHGSRDKHEAAVGNDRTAQTRYALDENAVRRQAEGHLPFDGASIHIDGRERAPWRRIAGSPSGESSTSRRAV
jgi:hypothetical protein